MKTIFYFALVVSAFAAPTEFDKYWNSGLAELARYELEQARYGNMTKGEMVVVTVTEPFRFDKQVKSELSPGPSDVAVLKVQTMKRFATGIYDYAVTTSSFKPLDHTRYPLALKVSGSSVDWCGHSWLQLNLRGGTYAVEGRSYFEEFGDQNFSIQSEISEDEIWQRIRMFGANLPLGEQKFVPSLASQRLRHKKSEPLPATTTLSTSKAGHEYEYSIFYKEGREVQFRFESKFPYKIVRHSETYLDGFQNPRELTTTAYLKKIIQTAYWREHDPNHLKNRRDFGVKGFDP